MDPQGSTPGQTQGGQQDPSPNTNPAENVVDDSQQPSQNDQGQNDDGVTYSSDEATGNQGSGAPSQTTDGADDTQEGQQGASSDDSGGVDPELTKWAASQNISLETPTEVALAKRLRDTQKAFHEKNQPNESKQKFDEATAPEDSEASKLAAIEGRLARADFFEANPDARQLEGKMFDYAVKLKESGDEAGFKYYSSPQGWASLYRIVKAEEGSGDYQSGREDERKNLAKAQQAGAPQTSANNSAPSDNKITDEKIGQMSMAEYEQYKKDNPDFNPFAL